MRKTIDNSAPYVLWLVPCAVGAFDAANVIDAVAAPVYTWLTVAAATVTILARGPRAVRELLAMQWDRAAAQAQVKEAALLAYQAHVEHCEAHMRAATTGELPRAVGLETTASIPALHVVRTPADSGDEQTFTRAVSVGRAAVPPQSRPVHLAAARQMHPGA